METATSDRIAHFQRHALMAVRKHAATLDHENRRCSVCTFAGATFGFDEWQDIRTPVS
jgi:hypothetical protein